MSQRIRQRGLSSQSLFIQNFVIAGMIGLLVACSSGGGSSGASNDPNNDPRNPTPPTPRKLIPQRKQCLSDQGETDGPSIIGGQRLTTKGPIGKAVVHVFIKTYDDGVRYYGESCSGTLIGTNMVLTAAHCFHEVKPEDVVKNTSVDFGNDPIQECSEESRPADDVVINRDFNWSRYEDGNDFVLIRIKGVAPSWAQPLPVATTFVDVRKSEVFLAGFGKNYDMDTDEMSTSPLKIAPVKAFGPSQTLAPAQQGLVAGLGLYNTASGNILAFDQSGGPAICQGDSGGPAIVRDNGVLKVIGVASFVIYPNRNKPTCTLASAHDSIPFHRQWLEETYKSLMTAESSPNPFALPAPAPGPMADAH